MRKPLLLLTPDERDDDLTQLAARSPLVQEHRRTGYDLARADIVNWLRERAKLSEAGERSTYVALRAAAACIEQGLGPEEVPK